MSCAAWQNVYPNDLFPVPITPMTHCPLRPNHERTARGMKSPCLGISYVGVIKTVWSSMVSSPSRIVGVASLPASVAVLLLLLLQ